MTSLLIGVFVAILSGGLLGLLHAWLSVTFKVDQIIGGTVINILAVGVTGFLNRQLFFEKGSIFGGNVPHAPGTLPIIAIPGLIPDSCLWQRYLNSNRLPGLRSFWLLFPILFSFEPDGDLRTRAVGEHPRAADTVGINVSFMRYMNVIIGGCLAGLGGAYFTLESVPSFEPLMTNGRGFISLAAMIFGNWTPIGAWAAALVFGAAQALQINLQFFRDLIPQQWAFLQQSYIVGLIPYILTMMILAGMIGRTDTRPLMAPPTKNNQRETIRRKLWIQFLKPKVLQKSFPGVLANDHVNFTLQKGEIHALLGENGAGKSTLMNILYGLISPDEGTFKVNGKQVTFSLTKRCHRLRHWNGSPTFHAGPGFHGR